MKKNLLAAILMLAATIATAQKQLYTPNEWKADPQLYAESDPEAQSTWSRTRSRQSENFIVYWDKGYGQTAPDQLNKSDFYYIDLDDLLQKAETFYQLNVETLGFGGAKNSKVTKYKSMILLNHTTEWMAYGGGYDFMCPALWVNPSTCKPVGHTIAHEIGHSFQYVCYSDYGGGSGFHYPQGQGSGWWEQTAQWQAAMAYPDQKWTESWLVYGTPYFPRAANYAMTHEWMRYQSYWWHYFLVEHYQDPAIIGKIWCHDPGTPGTVASEQEQGYDANETLMSLKNLTTDQLYQLYFHYAMKMATADIDVDNCSQEGLQWTQQHPYTYNYHTLSGTLHQVAYSSCPQSTGFNIIPLNVPEPGTTIEVDFTSLKIAAPCADDDPMQYLNGDNQYVTLPAGRHTYNLVTPATYRQRAFRIGFVALLQDGTRQYIYQDQPYLAETNTTAEATATITATIPDHTQRLWMVITPTPRTYIRHLWDENILNDDQWPYTLQFRGTNILGAPYIDPTLPITDLTLTYNITIPRTTGTDYSGTTLTLDPTALSAIGTAFQMQAANISTHFVPWTTAAPTDGQIKLYSLLSNGQIFNQGYTTNTSGHWFNATGTRCTYQSGNAYLYSDLDPATLTFTIGQNPNHLTTGQTYTIRQALKYQRTADTDLDGTPDTPQTALINFTFNITCTPAGTTPTATLAQIQQDPLIDQTTHITAPTADPNLNLSNPHSTTTTSSSSSFSSSHPGYTLTGQPATPTHRGIIIRQGKKLLQK